jgi:MFS family permease
MASGVLITAATIMLAFLSAHTPVWALVCIFATFGIGFSMVNAPITNAAVSGMPTDRAGAASAVASTSRQIGVSLGVALCGSIAAVALVDPRADFTSAAKPLWLLCAVLGLVILGLGIFATSQRAIRSAERLAPLIAGPAHGVGRAHATQPTR